MLHQEHYFHVLNYGCSRNTCSMASDSCDYICETSPNMLMSNSGSLNVAGKEKRHESCSPLLEWILLSSVKITHLDKTQEQCISKYKSLLL